MVLLFDVLEEDLGELQRLHEGLALLLLRLLQVVVVVQQVVHFLVEDGLEEDELEVVGGIIGAAVGEEFV